MSSPKRYISRMLFFLFAVAGACTLLYPALERAFLTNVGLNGLILVVLFFGVILNFRSVLILRKEIRWLRAPALSLEPSVLKRLRLSSPLAFVLRNNQDKGNAVLSPSVARTILDSVGMRLDESRDISRYLIGLSTFLGLLGTFWGLMGTVGAVGDVIASLNVSGEDATQIFGTIQNSLKAPLEGMGTAFSSSLLGLSGALIMGFLDLQTSGAQNNFYNGLDEHLASLTRYSSSVGSSDDLVTSNAAYANALLEQMVESLADIRTRQQKATATEQERVQLYAELVRLISRIDRTLAQEDQRADARNEALLQEMRDSFKLLVRTISGQDKSL